MKDSSGEKGKTANSKYQDIYELMVTKLINWPMHSIQTIISLSNLVI